MALASVSVKADLFLLSNGLGALLRGALTLGLVWSMPVAADLFCFSWAQSYYEQVYCEVKVAGKGGQLPRNDEFRNNPPLTQALLLKPLARNAGIDLVMPQTLVKAPATRSVQRSVNLESLVPTPMCERVDEELNCAGVNYRIMGNRANAALAKDVLSDTNQMNLPRYQGALTDQSALSAYLFASYRHYLEKMIAIGLAGATLSYGKFEYLFHDFQVKGIGFSDRFETMYRYLKQDKQRIAVNTKASVPEALRSEDCVSLDAQLAVCVVGGRNFLFGAVQSDSSRR